MKEYHGARIAGREELDGVDFPSEVQLAIDDLAGSMREGLLALSVGGGHKVMNELIEEERTQLVGHKGKNDRARGPSATAPGGRKWSWADARSRPGAPGRAPVPQPPTPRARPDDTGVSRRRPTSWRARSRGWCRRRGR